SAARDYLAERGITRESADRFRLGYASAAPDRVKRAALGRGFTAAELDQAGLTARGSDRFRERLIFPLTDARGRVRGFGAGQMPERRRLCSTVFLAFDADAAGQEASLRGMEIARAKGLNVRVVRLPGGRDPAEVAAADPASFEAALDAAQPYLTYRVELALA